MPTLVTCPRIVALLTAISLLATGCEGPTPRQAPIAGTGSEGSRPPDEDQGEADVEPIPIPSPTGELIDKATSCTVRVSGPGFDGSGVIIEKQRDKILILTVAHAAREGIDRIDLFSLATYPRPAIRLEEDAIELVSTDDRADLALIRANVNADAEIGIAELAQLHEPAYAYSVGCGGGKPPTVVPEQILRAQKSTIRLRGGNAERFMWQTKKGQKLGRSGGPLLDKDGFLLGIALGKSGETGYYSHIQEISEYLIDNGHVGLVTCPELLKALQGN